MNFSHYELNLGADDVAEIVLDKQANVRLMDSVNFSNYRRGAQHRYYGGLAKKSPMRLQPPHAGLWHVAIDMGGFSGSVKASVRAVRC